MVERKKISLLKKLKIAYFKTISDRRRYLRVPLRVKVTNKATEMFEYFLSTNISVGGMFLRTETPYVVETFVKLEFSLPGEAKPILADGRVARAVPPSPNSENPPGMGIQFMFLSPEDKEAIERFVKKSGLQ